MRGQCRVVAVCLVLVAACGGTFRNRVVLPLDDSATGMAAEECDRECHSGHADDSPDYLRCLASCPGAVVAQNTTCFANDVPKLSICRVTDSSISGFSGSGSAEGKSEGASVLGAIVGGLVTAAAVGAVDSATKSHKSSSSESSNNSSTTSGNYTAPANQNLPGAIKSPAPAATHKPATPSKSSSNTPAQPSKGEK